MHCELQEQSLIGVPAKVQAGCGPVCSAPTASAEAPAEDPPMILIVDDDKDFLESYRKLLSALPSHPKVHTSTSASRAFALLDSESFSVLITDLKMPKVDGFQILMSV